MQIRTSQLINGLPDPKLTGSHTVHRHTPYLRYADPSSSEQVVVLRFYLPQAGRTISVCPDALPPYRALPLEQLEEGLDQRAGVLKEPKQVPSPTPSVAEQGALKRAWHRLQHRVEALRSFCGQRLPAVLNSAAELWIGLRRNLGSVRDILTFLSTHHRASLLGDYLCLRIIPV